MSTTSDAHGKGDHDGEHRDHPTVMIGVDAVIGFRSSSTSDDKVDAPVAANKTVTSLLFGAKWHPSKNFVIGARLPLVFASFAAGVDDTSAVTAGNLQITPAYVTHLDKHTHMGFEFGVALPTAGGDEFACPTQTTYSQVGAFPNTQCVSGYSGAQRKAGALRAANLSRAMEENALFARHRIGFSPKLSFATDRNGVEVGLSTKLDLLQHVGGVFVPDNFDKNATETDWVTTLHGFYHVVPKTFDAGLRLWVNGILEQDIHTQRNPTDKLRAQVAIEPALRVHAGPARFGAGFILPIGGEAGHDFGYKAVRLMAGGAF
jgi:hypothetical protein